jgi:hypothetical protein
MKSWYLVKHRDIFTLLWDLKARCVRKSPSLYPILNHLNPLHACHPPSTPRSCKWSPPPPRFFDQTVGSIWNLPHACYMLRPSHPAWCDHPNNLAKWNKLLSSSFCNFHPPLTSSVTSRIFLRTLFTNTLSLCSSFGLRDQVSLLYEVMVLCLWTVLWS